MTACVHQLGSLWAWQCWSWKAFSHLAKLHPGQGARGWIAGPRSGQGLTGVTPTAPWLPASFKVSQQLKLPTRTRESTPRLALCCHPFNSWPLGRALVSKDCKAAWIFEEKTKGELSNNKALTVIATTQPQCKHRRGKWQVLRGRGSVLPRAGETPPRRGQSLRVRTSPGSCRVCAAGSCIMVPWKLLVTCCGRWAPSTSSGKPPTAERCARTLHPRPGLGGTHVE